METPIYKCDLDVAVKDIFPAFPSFKDFLKYIVKKAMSEANIDVDETEIERIVNEGSFIRFTANNIPFRIKVE